MRHDQNQEWLQCSGKLVVTLKGVFRKTVFLLKKCRVGHSRVINWKRNVVHSVSTNFKGSPPDTNSKEVKNEVILRKYPFTMVISIFSFPSLFILKTWATSPFLYNTVRKITRCRKTSNCQPNNNVDMSLFKDSPVVCSSLTNRNPALAGCLILYTYPWK